MEEQAQNQINSEEQNNSTIDKITKQAEVLMQLVEQNLAIGDSEKVIIQSLLNTTIALNKNVMSMEEWLQLSYYFHKFGNSIMKKILDHNLSVTY